MMLLCMFGLLRVVHAEPNPQLIAAQDCFLEADFRHTDCAGILHTARKRDPRHWLQAVIAYSAPALAAKSARAQAVRAYPDGDVPGEGARFNRQWAALRAFVGQVFAGRVKDPCPNAKYFGGTMDPPTGAMVPAHCAAPTANGFYAVASRRHR